MNILSNNSNPASGPARKNIYFPHLDALRFFAFLVVFISHSAIFLGFNFDNTVYQVIRKSLLIHGDLGVGFFFVLSGFLITTLLFVEHEAKGSISIIKFYIRRILRIWPVYFMTLIVGFLVIPNLIGIFGNNSSLIGLENLNLYSADLGRIPWYLFFAGNFDLAYHAYISPVVGVLWSIAVEEQFYIVWPALMIGVFAIFKKSKNTAMFSGLVTVIVWSWIFRYINIGDSDVVKYATPAVVSDLAIGALLAVFVRWINLEKLVQFLTKKKTIVIYLLLGLFIITRNFISPALGIWGTIYEVSEPLIFSLFACYIILEQNYSPASLFKVSNIPFANYLGKISYGLYAYHMIFVFITSTAVYYLGDRFGIVEQFTKFSLGSIAGFILASLVALVMTVYVSHLSYRYIEKRFLHLKERIGY